MESSVVSEPRAVSIAPRSRTRPRAGTLAARLIWLVLVGNAVAIVWLWYHGGNVTAVHSTGAFLTSIARITGLLGAYLALVQVLLLSRLPALERLTGFDRLTVWHRWNGHACLYLILAHVFFSVWGYAQTDRIGIAKETSTMIWGGVYPGMIVATVSTALFLVVVGTSIVIVRRRLNYQAWYAVHFTTYGAIALGWFHQVPTGNELVLDNVAADYWASLYLATLGLLVVFRLLVPVTNAFRYRMKVAEVATEGPGVVSIHITGHGLDRLRAQPGQFFLWRFLARRGWWEAHPFSLSAAPDGRSLRITVKSLGDFTSRMRELAPGTRVVAEGPFGTFTTAVRRREKTLLVAGGIGITPVRALLEELDGDVIVLYRVISESDVLFREELELLAAERGIAVHILTGDHTTVEGRDLLTPVHLRMLVPDVADREVYVCGPPAMASAIEKNIRNTGVPSRYLHVERFAL
jgi:predicted ferric reductase